MATFQPADALPKQPGAAREINPGDEQPTSRPKPSSIALRSTSKTAIALSVIFSVAAVAFVAWFCGFFVESPRVHAAQRQRALADERRGLLRLRAADTKGPRQVVSAAGRRATPAPTSWRGRSRAFRKDVAKAFAE